MRTGTSAGVQRIRLAAAAVALLAASCTGAGPTNPPATSADATQPTAASSSAKPAAPTADATAGARAPICPDLRPPWVAGASHPKDGVRDPEGRIIFGQVNRWDEVIGQAIAPLFAMDADGSDVVQLFSCELERPRISPDGSRIAFTIAMDDQTWQVATIAADGTDLRILTSTTGYAETPDWSPDGTWLIYAHSPVQCSRQPLCESLHESLWRMNADGSDQHELGDKPASAWDWEPRLSPDGREVVFLRNTPEDGYRWVIMIRNLESGEERVAKVDSRDLEHPDWSPDGRFIIYHASPNGPLELVPADDATATPVILVGDADHGYFKPAYSPDGSGIVFGCGLNVCRMNADGSDFTVLVQAAGIEFNHFDWGPAAGT